MKIELVDTDKIKPDPNNPRKGVYGNDDLHNMASTFKHHSIIQPIEIDEKNNIIVGELRWRAAQIANLKKIPCIRKIGLTPTERLERQLIENIHHQKVDLGECVSELRVLLKGIIHELGTQHDKGCIHDEGIKTLAQRLGVNRSWLTEVLQIEKAPKKIKKEVEKYYKTKNLSSEERNGISVSQAVEIVKADKIIQDDLLKRAKEKVSSKKIRKLRQDYEQEKITLKELREPEKTIFGHTVFPMSFRPKHIELIKKGIKIQTSRHFPHCMIGDVVSLTMKEPEVGKIKILNIEEKKLKDFTEEDAKREGGYTLKEFKKVWKGIHSEWNPEDEVKVIHFEMIE